MATSKGQAIANYAISKLGCAYIYGGYGEKLCTPSFRKERAKAYPAQRNNIYINCPVLSGKKSACDGCKWKFSVRAGRQDLSAPYGLRRHRLVNNASLLGREGWPFRRPSRSRKRWRPSFRRQAIIWLTVRPICRDMDSRFRKYRQRHIFALD